MASDGLTFHGRPATGSGHGSPCPFTPATSQGCTPVASLPAPSIQISVCPSEAAVTAVLDVAQRDLLLAIALFHPPKA
jgi:hypothetical protein